MMQPKEHGDMAIKPKKKAKSNTTTMIVPKDLVKEIRRFISEETEEETRKSTPLVRDLIYTKADRTAVTEAAHLVRKLKKPMKAVHKVLWRLEDLEGESMPKADAKWLSQQIDDINDLKERLDDLT